MVGALTDKKRFNPLGAASYAKPKGFFYALKKMKKFISPNWKVLRKLSSSLTQAWFYVWDQADACGVYVYDEDYLAVDLGEKISFEQLLQLPNVQDLGGGRILLLDYIEVNYVNLKPDYNPHKPAFRSLEKNNLKLNSSLNQALFKLEDEDEKEDEGKDEGEGEKRKRASKFQKPELKEVHEFMGHCNMAAGNIWTAERVGATAKGFWNYYEANGWRVGKNPMKDWKAASRNWMNNESKFNPQNNGKQSNGQLAKGAKADPNEVFELFRAKYQSDNTQPSEATQGGQNADDIQDACVVD